MPGGITLFGTTAPPPVAVWHCDACGTYCHPTVPSKSRSERRPAQHSMECWLHLSIMGLIRPRPPESLISQLTSLIPTCIVPFYEFLHTTSSWAGNTILSTSQRRPASRSSSVITGSSKGKDSGGVFLVRPHPNRVNLTTNFFFPMLQVCRPWNR